MHSFLCANVLPSTSNAEQTGPAQSEPSFAQVSERDMLRLDDELAGLIEAADTPAVQDGRHSIKPEPASSVPGELAAAHTMSAATLPGTQQTQDSRCMAAAESQYDCEDACYPSTKFGVISWGILP